MARQFDMEIGHTANPDLPDLNRAGFSGPVFLGGGSFT
jgi:hypothetical protein